MKEIINEQMTISNWVRKMANSISLPDSDIIVEVDLYGNIENVLTTNGYKHISDLRGENISTIKELFDKYGNKDLSQNSFSLLCLKLYKDFSILLKGDYKEYGILDLDFNEFDLSFAPRTNNSLRRAGINNEYTVYFCYDFSKRNIWNLGATGLGKIISKAHDHGFRIVNEDKVIKSNNIFLDKDLEEKENKNEEQLILEDSITTVRKEIEEIKKRIVYKENLIKEYETLCKQKQELLASEKNIDIVLSELKSLNVGEIRGH